MALNPERRNRILIWLDELPRHFYRELGEVRIEGFPTMDRLSPERASAGAFVPFSPGTAWGAKWEYAWFRGSFRLPKEAEGERIVLCPDFGAEGLVFVDGRAAGAVDKFHREIAVARKGEPGASCAFLAEAYAGHGPREESVGPVPPGRIAVPEPGPTQAVVGRTTFGIWDDGAFALWVDASALFQLREALEDESLRKAEIDDALADFTFIADFELPLSERRASFAAARDRLAPLLSRRNGSTAPVMHVFGNSHLDLAWLWPFAETERKSARTMANQLALFEEYPEYRYFLCQAPLMLALKEGYPDLWARVKSLVREGRIVVDGGMWLEPDTNLPGGESLVRQFLYGIRFQEEEFGTRPRVLWLPDTFGFSAALPQIMEGCGIPYFATVKLINSAYSGWEKFPHTLFRWIGLDGSSVAGGMFKKSNSDIDPKNLLKRWREDRVKKDSGRSYLFPFGHGDGGGGPTRTHLEFLSRLEDLEGVPRTRMSSPAEFFDAASAEGIGEGEWRGELYFPEHRGTYTAQAAMKSGNRRAETALRHAELWGALAAATASYAYPYDEMERLWKLVLFNQFHDVISGVSIERVHAEAAAAYGQAIEGCRAVVSAALAALGLPPAAGNGEAAIANALPWSRRALVRLPAASPAAAAACAQLPAGASQKDGENLWVEAALPASGWISATAATTAAAAEAAATTEASATAPARGFRDEAGAWILENGLLRVAVDGSGRLSSIFDQESRRELAAAPCNDFRLYRDVTVCYDAWDISETYERSRMPVLESARVSIAANGPLFASLTVERPLSAVSSMRQEIVLARGDRKIEFRTTVDWREDHKLLKVAFPTRIRADGALHEIQFGHLRRPNERSSPAGAERFEVCNQRWTAVAEPRRGVAVLNDGKFGVSVLDGTIALTLLKAPLVPDMRADRGIHRFSYWFYPWNGTFEESALARMGYEANEEPELRGGGGIRSFFSVDDPAVVLETVKLAEDRSGDLILRLYESLGATVRCALLVDLPVTRARETDLLEKEAQPLGWAAGLEGKNSIELDFRPFEIKTVRLSLGSRGV
jgi:alpha-mannosidase